MRFLVPNVRKMGKNKDVESLIKTLKWGTHETSDKNFGKDERICEEAVRALGQIGDPRAIEPLLWFSGHTNAQHGGYCSDLVQEALLNIAKKAGTEPLLQPLFKELCCSDYSTEQMAALTLGKLGDWRAATPLVEALRKDIHSHSAGALGDVCADALRELMKKNGNSEWVTSILQDLKL